jgi:putative acetyltransferase
MSDKIEIRNIKKEDNYALAKIIRDTLAEFKANKKGTAFYEDATDHLYEEFQINRATYFVAVINNEIAGGAGIYPTKGLPPDTCELVKLYLVPNTRGKGIGKMLVQLCIDEAKKVGYKKIYLESMPELTSAMPMYEKFGFDYLNHSIGLSGHSACNIWMMKDI